MRKKYGFKDFISKSLPLKTIIPYIPLTHKTFTSKDQLKPGMKIVYYTTTLGNFSKKRTNNPRITKVKTNSTSSPYTLCENGVYLSIKEIFFYEEEKALGRVE